MLGHTCLQLGLGKPIGNTISALVLLLSTSSVSYVTSTETVMGSHHYVVLKEGHEGHTNIISCKTQLNVSVGMYFQSAESKTSEEIYDRFELINGYKKMFNMTYYNSTLPRHFTLSTNKVEKKHARKYTCYDNEGIGALLSTIVLTIVDSEPHCTITREEESSTLVLSCRFSFVGTVSNLNFQWENNDADGATNVPGGVIKISDNSVVCTIAVHDEDVSLDKHFTFNVLRKECQHSSCFLYRTPVVSPGVGFRFPSFHTTEVYTNYAQNNKWIGIVVASAVSGFILVLVCITITILVICRRRSNNKGSTHIRESRTKALIPNDEDPPQLTVTSTRSISDPQSTVSSSSPLINPDTNEFEKESRFRVSSAPTMPRIDSSDNMDNMQP